MSASLREPRRALGVFDEPLLVACAPVTAPPPGPGYWNVCPFIGLVIPSFISF
jgi:hypothetical protein